MKMDRNMKKIRIACGAGCSFDRIEPSEELIKKGKIDYLVFECLAERTMSDNMLKRLENPKLGYTPMLKERMERLLKLALDNNVKIITNMGASNIYEAVKVIEKISKIQEINNYKIGIVEGDDLTYQLDSLKNYRLINSNQTLGSLREKTISINAYLGSEGIKEALNNGANIVVTGRVADISLFTGPILHEFNWSKDEKDKMGQGILLGHLLECGGQITGGYFADPGYKDVKDLHKLGMPIAEINENGDFYITKVENTGGEVSERVCKEQLLYEINNPRNYITPDGTVDFSNVIFNEIGKDKVQVQGAKVIDYPNNYKVNIGYRNGYMGIGEISFGGENSIEKAELCKKIIEGRFDIVKPKIDDFRFDLVGYSSLFDTNISNNSYKPIETRLRLTVRGETEVEVKKAVREMDFMYTNGPAGSSGISVSTKLQIGIDNILIPREKVNISTKVVDIL